MLKKKIEFLKVLGQGAFGVVYLAEMQTGDSFVRRLAVKMLRTDMEGREQVLSRLRDEARLLGQLNHHNVLRIYDIVEMYDQPAILLEYVEGADLKQVLDFNKSIPLRPALQLVAAIASALDASYNGLNRETQSPLRIIHRDIKPSNVLLSVHGGVKVLDFGVARGDIEREGKTMGAVLGTAAFIPPEQWLRKEVRHEGDVYALGITFLNALLGACPERSPLDKDAFEQYRGELLDRVGERFAEEPIAKELLELLNAMTTFEPSARLSARETENRCLDLADQVPDVDLVRYARKAVPPVLELRDRHYSSEELPSQLSHGLSDMSIGSAALSERPGSGSETFAFDVQEKDIGDNPLPAPVNRGLKRILVGACALMLTAFLGWKLMSKAPIEVFDGAVCGNGVMEEGESCDDGNRIHTDICSNECALGIVYLHGMGPDGIQWYMGSDEPWSEREIALLEMPKTPVGLNPFWMHRHEVTREAYAVFSEAHPDVENRKSDKEIQSKPDYPVTNVTFDEALRYCEWTGGVLPSEVQWEYAARSGGKDIEYPWGDEEPTCERVLLGDHRCSKGFSTSVCSRPSGNSEQGICDLSGSVWEWVRTSFSSLNEDGEPIYPGVPNSDASAKHQSRGYWHNSVGHMSSAEDVKYRVIRGGGFWHTNEFFNRARARFFLPDDKHERGVGFRCVWGFNVFPDYDVDSTEQ
jgi:cysteine-rich repeat protein